MVSFDSNEYWLSHIWDRFCAIDAAPEEVRNELLRQEELTLTELSNARNEADSLQILDLACGTGRISKKILDTFSSNVTITALDLNPECIKIAQDNTKHNHNIAFIPCDIYNIDTESVGKFDIVICIDLLHHLSDLDDFLQIVHAILKPDGLFIGNFFLRRNYKAWDQMKHGKFKSLMRCLSFVLASKLYPYLPEKIRLFVRKHGFARIHPLREEAFIQCMKKLFVITNKRSSYYFWFTAHSKSIACHSDQS